ncbi:hypothetical protein HPB49_010231 [Dermacentor silvarum]|uniref:Uncharacterized protein n=1 Tax=Dermacentor silvarum TaxID=543639 RepID=A0ACB8DZ67_DERSI|nr:hypothetical protein HPB49_010231 [Dermacentor silvarum]
MHIARNRDISSDDGSESDDPGLERPPSPQAGRLGNIDWCRCKYCGVMPTVEECVCCKDIAEMRTAKLCVTLETDFEAPCLNTAVLRVAYIDVHVNREDAEIVDDHMHVQSTEIVRRALKSLRVAGGTAVQHTDSLPGGHGAT